MSFNASIGANITNLGDVAIAANQGTDGWYFTGLLFAFFVIFLGVFSKFYDTKTAVLADFTFTTLVGLILYWSQEIAFETIGVLVACTVLMLFYYIWDG